MSESIFNMFDNRKVDIPEVDNSIKIIENPTSLLFLPRVAGTIYDDFLKHELGVLNINKKHYLDNGEIWTLSDWVFAKKNKYVPPTFEKVKSRLSHNNYISHSLVHEYIYNSLLNVDYSLFKAKNLFVSDFILSCYNHNRDRSEPFVSNKIEPDLLIDDKLIDIKMTNTLSITKSYIVQLITYAVWLNNMNIIRKREPFCNPNGNLFEYKKILK